MFGTYRILLAIMVAYVHLAGSTKLPGHYGIIAFFLMSGYLITFIINRNYGYWGKGLLAYAINRALRIYPMYWLCCLFAIGVIFYVGPSWRAMSVGFVLPSDPYNWFQNFGLALRHSTKPHLIQTAWTLTVELIYYALMGLGISRNRWTTGLWLAASLVYTGYLISIDASFNARYFSIASASLPFAVGAAIYHWKEELTSTFKTIINHPHSPGWLFLIFTLNGLIGDYFDTYYTLNFYINLPICVLIHLALFNRKSLFGISKRVDKFFADVSYPLYLVHVPLGWMLMKFSSNQGWESLTTPTLNSFFAFILPALVVSVIMTLLIENPIEKLRTIVKHRLL